VKLYLITRDGKAANDFLENHNLTKSNVVIVKNVSDLDNASGGYVIIPPLPLNYQWAIRPKLLKLKNYTRYYNKLNLI